MMTFVLPEVLFIVVEGGNFRGAINRMKKVSLLLSLLLVFSSMVATAPQVLADGNFKEQFLEEKAPVFGDLITRIRGASEDNDGGSSLFSLPGRPGAPGWLLTGLLNTGGNHYSQLFLVPGLPLFLLFLKLIFYF